MEPEVLAGVGAFVTLIIGATTTAIVKLWGAVRKTSNEPAQNALLERMCEQLEAQTEALRNLTKHQELYGKMSEQRAARMEQDVQVLIQRSQH